MAVRPEELEEPDENDMAEVAELERCIDAELKMMPKKNGKRTEFTVGIRRGGKTEPNHIVKRMLGELYLAAGWEEVNFAYKEVPAGDTYWEEFIVKLKRKI